MEASLWTTHSADAQIMLDCGQFSGMRILRAVPAVSVSKLEKLTLSKLVEVRNGDMGEVEVDHIQTTNEPL